VTDVKQIKTSVSEYDFFILTKTHEYAGEIFWIGDNLAQSSNVLSIKLKTGESGCKIAADDE